MVDKKSKWYKSKSVGEENEKKKLMKKNKNLSMEVKAIFNIILTSAKWRANGNVPLTFGVQLREIWNIRK